MRIAGKTAAITLTHLSDIIKPGITTREIDHKAEMLIRAQGCTPAFLNYKDFPNTACISVNDEVVHCIPSNRVLKDGDIVTVDLGAIYEGYCSDTAKTFLVGYVSENVQKFVEIGYKSLRAGIAQAVHGNHVADISNAVANTITPYKYGIVKQFVGHGIGANVHEPPQIPNVLQQAPGPELVANMVICIEPILTLNENVQILSEGSWNTRTSDNCFACHWEHTVHITQNGPEIFTLRDEETP